jgi:hypothetical protein
MSQGSSDCEQVAEKDNRSVSVVYRRISELKLDPRNPRLHTSKQVRQIARSIEKAGILLLPSRTSIAPDKVTEVQRSGRVPFRRI